MLRVAVLDHMTGNIGHVFMSVGLSEAVQQAFGADVEITHIEQHQPFDIYPPRHWARAANRLPHGRFKLIRWCLINDLVQKRLRRDLPKFPYALAIACGGPSLIPGASRVPEMHLLLHHLNGAFSARGVPLVDAAMGSAFPIERKPYRFDAEDEAFYRKALSLSSVVTVRDTVAQSLCAEMGRQAPLIPCGAIGVGRPFERLMGNRDRGSHVVVNFQARGANTDWGQNVDEQSWRLTVQQVIADLRKRHAVRMLAHSEYERRLAGQVAPDLPCDQPRDTVSYAEAIGGAKVGFVSRIHAAIPLAGIGVPSLVIGNDTRLGTVETMGLPTLTPKAATAGEIISTLESLIAKGAAERERLRTLREETIGRYADLFRSQALSA
jgi:hypothetical protein